MPVKLRWLIKIREDRHEKATKQSTFWAVNVFDLMLHNICFCELSTVVLRVELSCIRLDTAHAQHRAVVGSATAAVRVEPWDEVDVCYSLPWPKETQYDSSTCVQIKYTQDWQQ